MSGATATFRLPSGNDLQLIVSLHQSADSALAADIAFRSLQRLTLATAQRLERLFEPKPPDPPELMEIAVPEVDVVSMTRVAGLHGGSLNWLKNALGMGGAGTRTP